MQPNRRAARTGMIIAVALAGSTLAGASWASSQMPEQQRRDRCVTSLEAKPVPTTDPSAERKSRCPLAVRYVPRDDSSRAAIERDEAVARPIGRRA